MTLSEAAEGEPTGLRSFRFQLAEPHDFADVKKKLAERGVEAKAEDGALCVKDPDGFTIEFHPAANAA
jgi:hypothetical protein